MKLRMLNAGALKISVCVIDHGPFHAAWDRS
jgi:hypothetical protein